MPRRDDEAFKHERAAFNRDIYNARAYLSEGQVEKAADLAISPAHKYWYGKEDVRFKLLKDLYELVDHSLDESLSTRKPWQGKLMGELYKTWPKLYLEDALLKHSFPEPHVDELTVSGAEAVHLAEYRDEILSKTPVALSQGRYWLKIWELETGRVIWAEESELPLLASAIGRDASLLLHARSWGHPYTGETQWSVSFKESFRKVTCLKLGAWGVSYYTVTGDLVRIARVNPASDDYTYEVTIKHDEIKGYLPAGTTSFIARSSQFDRVKVDNLLTGTRVVAKLAVVGEDSWLEEIVGRGLGLRGIYNFTTPPTAVSISSDGNIVIANGNGYNFGMWNFWTGERLREFIDHTGRVTCLCMSVDVSFAVSGSEDKTVRVWTPIDSECVGVFEGHEQTVSKVCISLDATKILSADSGGVIKLWDRASGECLRTIKAHDGNISGLHFTMDAKFAASSSWDKTVKLWNLSEGSCMRTFEHGDWATSVEMTPDCRYLVSSSYEGTKVWELLWKLEPRDPVEWDAGARPFLEILMNANGAWEGKLGTTLNMYEEDIKKALRRQGPSWIAWHAPSAKNDWDRVWHLNWDIEETLGYAGYGWLSHGPGDESRKIMGRT